MFHKCRHSLWQSDTTICLWAKPAKEPGMICGTWVDYMSFRSLLKQAEWPLIYCCKQQKPIVLTAAKVWRGFLLQGTIWSILYLPGGLLAKVFPSLFNSFPAVILSIFLLPFIVAWPKHPEKRFAKEKVGSRISRPCGNGEFPTRFSNCQLVLLADILI